MLLNLRFETGMVRSINQEHENGMKIVLEVLKGKEQMANLNAGAKTILTWIVTR
jgi:hypothetical protein